jgi:hypothetical protein
MSEEERPSVKGETPEPDDVEAHRHPSKAMNDEGAEGEGEDDFEAHRHSLKQRPGTKG